MWWQHLLILVVGILIGIIAYAITTRFSKRSAGTLKIDHSNPNKDVYRFEIDNLDALSTKKRITLKVDNEADLSQK
jgi:uncharacterized membrane-anchored protein YhcB (DUF1043 family)